MGVPLSCALMKSIFSNAFGVLNLPNIKGV